MIVPRRYKTFLLDKKTGVLREGTFTVSGRKIPLLEIRERELTRLEDAGVVRGYSDTHYLNMTREQIKNRFLDIHDEALANSDLTDNVLRLKLMETERTRYLKQWADNSTILNHGHFLMMVSSIYDEAFFFTSKELEQHGRPGIDVQQIVERPHVYILGRCSSSEIEQLGYVSTRGECLKELTTKVALKNGIEIIDKMRFFTGDGPEQDTECGEQQGGHAGCVACSGDSRKYRNMLYSYGLPVLSLSDRIDNVRCGPAGRSGRNGGHRPFVNLSIEQLRMECRARDLDDGGTKKDLEARLKKVLGGIQRVPALLLHPYGTTLQDLNLQHYEVSPTEPLHDIKEHIRNLFTEVTYHLLPEEKDEFVRLKDIMFAAKEKLKGSDFREGLIVISQNMRGKCRPIIQHIFDTMIEITAISYSNAEKRSPKQVLRFHNQTFLHFMRCKILIGNLPKHLTSRKMYGRYWHSLTTHAPILHRIISLTSVHTEEEERTFSTINSIAKGTTSRRPGEIITPTLVRIQAESKQKEKMQNAGSSWSQQNSKISQLSAILPKFPNSLIPNGFLTNYPAECQCHLERISDFLLPGEGVWWRPDLCGIEFFDSEEEPNTRPEGPFLHHFRYSNMKKEQQYLKECWTRCLKENVSIPHIVITARNDSDSEDIEIQTGLFERGNDDSETDDNGKDNGNQSENNSDPEEEIAEHNSDPAEEIQIGFSCEANDIDLALSDTEEDKEIGKKALTSDTPIANTDPAPTANSDPHSATDTVCHPNKTHTSPLSSRLDITLKTDLARNIFKVIPEEKELIMQLDKARVKWKDIYNNKNSSILSKKTANDHYLNVLAQAQTKVLASLEPLKTNLRRWEENFYFKNHRIESEDILNNPDAYSLYKKLKLCKQLLSHWKISFH